MFNQKNILYLLKVKQILIGRQTLNLLFYVYIAKINSQKNIVSIYKDRRIYYQKHMYEPESMIEVKYFLWFSFSSAYVRELNQIHKFKCRDIRT